MLVKPRDLRVLTHLQETGVENKIDCAYYLYVGKGVPGPAVHALYLLACNNSLRVVVVIITAFLHEVVQTIITNLQSLNQKVRTYHIGAAILASESRDLTKRCLVFAIVTTTFVLSTAIALKCILGHRILTILVTGTLVVACTF